VIGGEGRDTMIWVECGVSKNGSVREFLEIGEDGWEASNGFDSC
jgi:hypothetical protein